MFDDIIDFTTRSSSENGSVLIHGYIITWVRVGYIHTQSLNIFRVQQRLQNIIF